MRTRRILRTGLHGLLVAWLAAVAVAPLWHTGHAVRPVAEETPGHDHGVGAWLCGPRPATVHPSVDCVLCKAQRLLSHYWTRAPGATAPFHAAAAPAVLVPSVPPAGERLPVAARAPPLC